MDGQERSLLCRTIVDQAPEAIVFADRNGTIRLWNAGAERMFGYTETEAVGQSLDLIIPPKQRDRHWQGWSRVMQTAQTRYGDRLLAVPALHRDRSRLSIEFSVVLVKDDEGEMRGVAAILRDVTERWQQDKELRARLAENTERS